jgi:hypothetical protein
MKLRRVDAPSGIVIAARYRHGGTLGASDKTAGKRDGADGSHAAEIEVAAGLIDLTQDVEGQSSFLPGSPIAATAIGGK